MGRQITDMIANAESAIENNLMSDVVSADESTNSEDSVIEQLPEEVADIQEETEDEQNESPDESDGIDSFESIVAELPENKRKKYYNSDGSLKSREQLLAMHLNAEKLIGASVEKKKEYLGSDSLDEVPLQQNTEIDDDVEVDNTFSYKPEDPAREQEKLNELAMVELEKLNIQFGLDLNLFEDGAEDFDPNNTQHRKAWELAQKTARTYLKNIKEETLSRIAPLEESQKKVAYQTTVKRVLKVANIKGVTPEEVTNRIMFFTPEQWRSMPDSEKFDFIEQQAKVIAYDNSQKNVKIIKPEQEKNPVLIKAGGTIEGNKRAVLTPRQEVEFNKLKSQFSGFITPNMEKIFQEDVIRDYPEKGGKR